MPYERSLSPVSYASGRAAKAREPASNLPASASAEPPRPEDLSNRALLGLLSELVQELELRSKMQLGTFRDEFERTITDAVSELEKLTPNRQKRATAPADADPTKSGLSPAKAKAVRAACGAGVPHSQVARHFGVSRADIRKVLAEPA
jgi:hypothetical protein